MPPGRKPLDPAVKAQRRRASLYRYAEKSGRLLVARPAFEIYLHATFRNRETLRVAARLCMRRLRATDSPQIQASAHRHTLQSAAKYREKNRTAIREADELRRTQKYIDEAGLEAFDQKTLRKSKPRTQEEREGPRGRGAQFRQSQSQFRFCNHYDPPLYEHCPYRSPHVNVPPPMQYDGTAVKIWEDPGPGVQRRFSRNSHPSPHDRPDIVPHPAALPHQKTYPSYTLPSGVEPSSSTPLLPCAPFAQALPRIHRRRLNTDAQLPRRPQNPFSLKKTYLQRRAASFRRGRCLDVPVERRGALNVHVSARLQSPITPPTTNNYISYMY
ncbi:hypothetical protein B0H16DRAFT_1745454 [Mycena metata]|uniref:Uncharacterized protein n=1 Tax=Mycena metata TaxID=1033252 RepID=A0AAD7H485_9AGAR|nr:hypothetical protein B0H16DRAFT_1745454 [Mycena metata]